MSDGDALDAAAELDRRLAAWLERTLGGKVATIERQGRWRAAWYVDLAQDGGTRRLYVRGVRPKDPQLYPLRREFEIHRLLEAAGLPVPHVYGLCPDPLAIVMAHDSGQANLGTAATEAERRSVMDHYIALLAQLHSLDTAPFEAAGLHRPVASEEIALHRLEEFVAEYRAAKIRPEPLLEFMVGWARRNAPRRRRRVALVTGDPAQFLFRDGRVTTLIDFELAFLGDPLYDLAALQLRATVEPLGDIGPALARYAELSGEPIDAEAFDFYAMQFALIAALSSAELLARPQPNADMAQTLEWSVHANRLALDLIARRAGVELPPLAPHEVLPGRYAPMAQRLVGAIRDIAVADSFQAYQRDAAAGRLAAFLSYVAEHGPALERADLADAEALLGARFDSWQAADAALEAFVARAGPEFDQALIGLFYRRLQRQLFLIEPTRRAFQTTERLKTFAELTAGP